MALEPPFFPILVLTALAQPLQSLQMYLNAIMVKTYRTSMGCWLKRLPQAGAEHKCTLLIIGGQQTTSSPQDECNVHIKEAREGLCIWSDGVSGLESSRQPKCRSQQCLHQTMWVWVGFVEHVLSAPSVSSTPTPVGLPPSRCERLPPGPGLALICVGAGVFL